MAVKHKKLAFTLVELLAVLAIITILVALLIPALTVVRNTAKETQQKAQFTTIEMGLTAFKNDYGDYPPSGWQLNNPHFEDYSGAQMLAEALVGWDLLGFHPKSAWRSDGKDKDGGNLTYDPDKNRDADHDGTPDTLKERRGPYLELATTNVFRLSNSPAEPGLFDFDTTPLEEDTFVLCDVFAVRRITLPSGNIARAGTPILYYRANTSSKTIDPTESDFTKRIYNAYDNYYFISLGSLTVDGKRGKDHPLGLGADPLENLYKFDYEGGIRDSKVEAPIRWPHRPDSYILISAGVDGLYGTSDDIRNF
jgi:prepilin-type N-terminal cleavage/methylation domain-containing protein